MCQECFENLKKDLLYDFEDKIVATNDLGPKLAKLKQRYAAVGKENKIIKKKMASTNADWTFIISSSIELFFQ